MDRANVELLIFIINSLKFVKKNPLKMVMKLVMASILSPLGTLLYYAQYYMHEATFTLKVLL